MTVLLVIVWIESAWACIGYLSEWGAGFGIDGGVLYAALPKWTGEYAGTSWQDCECGWMWGEADAPKLRWSGSWQRGSSFWFAFDLPLWIPSLLCTAGTIFAWRLDDIARRRVRAGFCPKCDYDRTGLAAGAVCPECGA